MRDIINALNTCNLVRGADLAFYYSYTYNREIHLHEEQYELLVDDWTIRCKSKEECIDFIHKFTELKQNWEWM